jgi:glycosyltransferase involved in cell wall biosynthesis
MIVGLFPDLIPFGGIQTAGRHTAAVLSRMAAERGWPAHFLSLNDPTGEHECRVGKISFRFQGFARAKIRFALEAVRLAGQNPQLVYAAHPNLAVPAAAMRLRSHGFKLIVQAHGVEVWQPLGRLRQSSLRRADRVFAPSRETAQKLSQIQHVPERNIRVIPWGLDPSFLDFANRAASLSRPLSIPNSRYILAVGRWASSERYKGFDTLIRALPTLRADNSDLQLVFAGGGDDRPSLEHLATDLNVASRVHFVSGLTREELAAAYRHAEVFALPSSGEGFGLVFLEAMAMGRPVVGGNHGGIPDIIEEGVTGFLVAHGDVATLAARLDQLLADQNLRQDMGNRARERVLQEFRFEAFESRFRAALVEVMPS